MSADPSPAPREDEVSYVWATPADVPELSVFGRDSYTAHFGTIWSADGLQTYLDQQFTETTMTSGIVLGDSKWLLARDDSALLGYAKIRPERAPAPGEPPGTELEKIYLSDQATGRGTGSTLISMLLADANATGVDNVWLDVLKTNLGAQRVYERHGFAPIRERSFATDLNEVGMVTMRRPRSRLG